ncbi:MAG: hypothetical protein WBD87_14205 [Candidatus Acidiferrales bacterium]
MRRNILIVALSFLLLPVVAWGQQQQNAPLPMTTQRDVYCSGKVTTTPVSRSIAIVSGEQSLYKITFDEGDIVYLNQGSNKGVKAGDVFSVMRPVSDYMDVPWFGAQSQLLKAMGQMWEDEGRLKVLVAYQNTSIAQVTNSCEFMQRGDTVVPFVDRPVPELKSETNFDRFAPPSGKKRAMIVTGKGYRSTSGTNDVVYVNLGSNQGVKVGDYFRIFRYQSNGDSNVYQTPNMGTEVYGFGAAPGHYSEKDLPREVLGEGVVLRSTPNASTVLITLSLREIYGGDYCELE